MYVQSLGYKLLDRPLGQELVLGGQVFCVGRVLILTPVTHMLGNEFMSVVNLH